jgi:hypothetical protein
MKTQNLVFGASSGKLGNVVASRVYGDNIVRSKPLEVYNPRTAKQVNMRTIMATVVAIAKAAILYLAITKRTARTGRSKKMSAYAYLIKDILANKQGETPNIELKETGITLGTGDLIPTSPSIFKHDISDDELVCQWPTAKQGNQLDTDICTLILFNLTNSKVFVSTTTGARADGELSIDFPADFDSGSNNIAAFLAFENQEGTLWDAPTSIGLTTTA